MTNSILVFQYFSESLIAYFFGIRKKPEIYFSGKCIVENTSYRLPQSASSDWLIVLKVLRKILLKILKKESIEAIFDQRRNTLIFDGTNSNFSLRERYVRFHTGMDANLIARDQLQFSGFSMPFLFSFIFTLIFVFPLLIWSFFSVNRANIGLILLEYIECCNLLLFCKKNSIRKIFVFCPYEKDSNLVSLILMKNGITVSKHPSPGPLMTHNSVLVADEVVLSSQYQMEELVFYKETMFVKKVLKWYPEFSLTYIDRYKNKLLTTPSNTVGYYSHGSWLRKAMGHTSDNMNVADSEAAVLKCLNNFLQNNKQVKLIIFPHPREKQASQWRNTIEHYQSIFLDLAIEINTDKIPTALSFDSVDVAVSAFSTIVYERLFCGFKTLIASFGILNFPVPGSSLNNIVVKNEKDFTEKLLTALQSDPDMFFTGNKLSGYRYADYRSVDFT